MTTIGLTGGIGSGKSTVGLLLRVYGIPVYVADDESKRLCDISPRLQKELKALLGDEIYHGNMLNRRLMASRIFGNPDLLTQVNSIIHPAVFEDFSRWTVGQDARFVALESAILFESGFDAAVDAVLMVYAPEKLRLQRVVARDGMSEAQVRLRMNNQSPDEDKISRADFVIYNDDSQSLIRQTRRIMNSLSAGH
ncbi:MAG: dephospho-CoA kinase [Tannerella sp.]|jgi:dephospho-CoA kinase|nr:dephospho-CoA kinase [Tannerella sp.]